MNRDIFQQGLKALPLMFLLVSCGISRGQCEIPDSDSAIEQSLKLSALNDIIQRKHISINPAEYLASNPNCCSIESMPFSLFEWLFYDRYSAPKYRVKAHGLPRRANDPHI
jgi:hypothetical protein